jgi:hypothetical protein
MTDGQQLVALDGLVVPRLPTVSGEDGSGHARLAPILVTKEDYFDRVLANAGFLTLAEMKFFDFCTAPWLSIPVRQCFFLAVKALFLYFNHELFFNYIHQDVSFTVLSSGAVFDSRTNLRRVILEPRKKASAATLDFDDALCDAIGSCRMREGGQSYVFLSSRVAQVIADRSAAISIPMARCVCS